MKDLVLIPTFMRPEYLAICLEHLVAAEGGKGKHILISHDRHATDHPFAVAEIESTKEVVRRFTGKFASLDFHVVTPHPYMGNPCNFLELYKRAFMTTDVRYIYLVEDDVLISPDFFKWHEAAQARGDYFITVGWHCIRNPEVKPLADPTAYIESTRDFSSIGICWKKDKLAAFVKHARPEYYRSNANYLRMAFPGSPINPGQWTEQAGVVTRLLHEAAGTRWVAWPTLARCAHVGIQGYHRPQGHRFTGTLDSRIEALRLAVNENGALARLSKDAFDDVQALNQIPDWNPADMHVVQRFPYERGKI